MSTSTRPRAAFGVQRRNIPGVLIRAMAMYNGISSNVATFASPTIGMVAFLALVTALSAQQQATKETQGKAISTSRNTKRDAVWTAMEILQKYVQGLADALAAEAAAQLIASAGLLVAGTATRTKAVLTAVLTAASGTVHLEANRTVLVGKANRGKVVFFAWEMSSDGGKTWTALPTTGYASTNVPGLALMSTYAFRVSVTVGNTPGAWSQDVSILVH